MGYVDLRERSRRRRGTRGPAGGRHYAGRNPYLLVALGFALGMLASILASPIFYIGFNGPDPLATLLFLIIGVTMLGYAGYQCGGVQRFPSPKVSEPKFGGEKQLLLAIQSTGGSVTPVEAALETSLTVDEAEEILTRFADRGHLLVESRDGVLSYALPGGRTRGLDGV